MQVDPIKSNLRKEGKKKERGREGGMEGGKSEGKKEDWLRKCRFYRQSGHKSHLPLSPLNYVL